MITCKQCIDSLTDDPRIRSGKYRLCGCDYCEKPSYYRELEQIKPETQPIFRPRPVDKEIDQLKSSILYLQGKMNEHIDASKKAQKGKGDLY